MSRELPKLGISSCKRVGEFAAILSIAFVNSVYTYNSVIHSMPNYTQFVDGKHQVVPRLRPGKCPLTEMRGCDYICVITSNYFKINIVFN